MLNLRAVARIKDVFVNFVRKAERVKLLTKCGDKFHFRTRENFSGWVVGITNNDRFRVGVEGGAQFVWVETPIRRPQWHITRFSIRKDRVRRVVLVKGFEDDDFLAR